METNKVSRRDQAQGDHLACYRCKAQRLKCVRPYPSQRCRRCIGTNAACKFGSPARSGRSSPGGIPPSFPTRPISPPPSRNNPRHNFQSIANGSGISHGRDNQSGRVLDVDPRLTTGRDGLMETLDDDEFISMFCNPGHPTNGYEPTGILEDRTDSQGMVSGRTHGPMHSIPVTGLPSSMSTGSTTAAGVNRDFVPSSGSCAMSQRQRMQRLMHLGAVMYDLQETYSSQGTSPSSGSSGGFPADFAGEVLRTAKAFLESLQSFSSPPDSRRSSRAPSIHERMGPPVHLQREYPGLAHPFGATHSRLSSAHGPSSSSSIDSLTGTRSIGAADKPVSLQIIACYLRLLQLYLLLYHDIMNHVRRTGSGMQARLPIWNNLQIGGVSLDAFSDCQFQLVLQVAEHFLYEIESTLGLAEGCRVSKPSVVEGNGILNTNVSSHFIEMCMYESTSGAEDCQGTVAGLREIMTVLAGLLDRPVWFKRSDYR